MSNRDYKWLSQWKWHAHKDSKTFYAQRAVGPGGRQKIIQMHSLIFGGTCDHKNRDGLDNRRCNLRAATFQQQIWNQGLREDNTSGFKGVFWHRDCWRSMIRVNGKLLHLGFFKVKKEAAKAYDKAAKKYHGEFAVLNFPKGVDGRFKR